MQTNQKEAQIITGRLKAPNGNPTYITKSSLQQTNHSFRFSDDPAKVAASYFSLPIDHVITQNAQRTARLQNQPRPDRIVPVASGGFTVCDDGGQSGGNRLERILEHDYRTQCLGGCLAELANVILCDVDQYRIRYIGCLGIGAL